MVTTSEVAVGVTIDGDAHLEEICKELEMTYQTVCMDALNRAKDTATSSNAVSTGNVNDCDTITTENEKNLCSRHGISNHHPYGYISRDRSRPLCSQLS